MKRLLKEKLCAWTLAGVTLFTTVIPTSSMVYADTGTVSGTDGVETQTSEDTTMGKVAFKLPESGGSITVNVEKSETQKDSTVIDIDDSGKTVVSVNGTESVVEPTEDGYSYVMEEAVGTELEVILQCDEGWDVSLYRVLSDSGDVLTEKDNMSLQPFSQSFTDVGYKETLTVSEDLQIVDVSFEEKEVVPVPSTVPTEPEEDADDSTETDDVDSNTIKSDVSNEKIDESSEVEKDTTNVEEPNNTPSEDLGEANQNVNTSEDEDSLVSRIGEPTATPPEDAETIAFIDPNTTGISTFAVGGADDYVIKSERFDVFDDQTKPPATDPRLGIAIKWIDGDDNQPDSLGLWRAVYCLEYENASPTGETAHYKAWCNRKIAYAMYYGCMYWGQPSRYHMYSMYQETGDWRYDYYVTQWAIHILNDELTFAKFQSAMNSCPYATPTLRALVIDRVNNIVKAANSASNYSSFTSDGWFDMSQGTFATNGSSTINQNFTLTKSGDYWYSPWYTPTFTSYYGYEAKNFIDTLTFNVPSGVTVERDDTEIANHNTTMRRFRFKMTNSAYASSAGKELTFSASITSKRYWGVATYAIDDRHPDGAKVQDMGLWTWSGTGGDFTKTINLKTTIPESKGKAYITKSSSNTTVVSGNSNYSLDGAQYGIYTNKSCTANTKVSTLTTKNGGTTDTVELTAGTYYIKEISAPKGYILDTTVYTCKVTQGSTTKVEVKDAPRTVTINLTKTSGNTDVTNGNVNYKLDGAVYGLYNNSSCTDLRTRLTTNASGKASVTGLPLGTYWIKEITPSQGYDLDTTVHKVEATSGTTNVVTKSVSSVEPPKTDPVTILLKKVDAETGNTAQGNATLEGAQFEVKFYSQRMDTDPGAAGHTPLRTWVFRTVTTPSGTSLVYYSEECLVSGDKLYYDSLGAPSLPYGTVTIKEIAAPDGYLLNDETFVAKIGDTLDTPVYHEPTIEDPALSIDIKKVQSGTSYPIEGVTFKHSGPDGFTEEAVTDANGNVSFNGLTHGNHTIEEIETVDGFALNTQKITFTVNRDNSIKITSGSTETDTNGNITVTVGRDGNIDATVENKPAPFDLHIYKINNHDFALQGAEFTLYSDDHCTQVVDKQTTDTAGNLTFQDLIVGKTYYMKETKAPQGYRIPVNDDGSDIVWTIKAESYPTEGTFNFIVNGVTYTDKSTGSITVTGTTADRIANMTVVNEVGLKLPNTGSNMMILLVMAGVALMAGAIVISGTHNMKKKRMEE